MPCPFTSGLKVLLFRTRQCDDHLEEHQTVHMLVKYHEGRVMEYNNVLYGITV